MINLNNNTSGKTRLRNFICAAAFAFILTAGFSHQAHADYHHGPGGHGHFHGYNDHDWHGGHWYHGVHDGRPGWWWSVNGVWYSYPAPVYPYPANPYAPPVVYAAPAPVVVAAPPPPAPAFNLVVPLHIR
jgi:hypothetical protein